MSDLNEHSPTGPCSSFKFLSLFSNVTFLVICGGHTENAHKVPCLTKYCLEVVGFDMYTNKINHDLANATMTLT